MFSFIQSANMSLKVIKAGILDSVQDMGRIGYQHLGINPSGAMDRFAAQTANILVGNNINEAVIEMHFPAAAFLMEQTAIIAISGADFLPTINGEPIPLWNSVLINKNSVLQFEQLKSGARTYIAVKGGLQIPEWLDSYSTNLKAIAGGFNGRAFKKDDVIAFRTQTDYSNFFLEKDLIVLSWQADTNWNLPGNKIFIIPGNEWNWLNNTSQYHLLNQSFIISAAADRMGYRLTGTPLITDNKTELISSPVGFGTVQLLPDGQLIILMADHQTTGGYPRVAHVITAHLSQLAQMRPGEKINFSMTEIKTAEELLIKQQQHLLQLQNAYTFRLAEFLNQ
jgi:antagonist of KipI